MSFYSTKKLSVNVLEEIKEALAELDFGSVEIFVQNSIITQITKREIKKTTEPHSNHSLVIKNKK